MLHDGLGVLALREAGARQEAAKAPILDDHLSAAQLTDLLGLLLGDLEPGVLEGLLGLLHIPVKALVEVFQYLLPGDFPLLDQIQLLLHMGGELHVDDVLEPVHHQARHHLAERRGPEAFFLFHHVVAVLDGRDDAGIGGGPAHALFLHGPHQRGLGIAGGRRGEMLLRANGLELQRLSLSEVRQGRLDFLLLVVLSLFVEGGEAGKFEALVVGPEHILPALGLDGHVVVEGAGHLRGGEAVPDQLIEPELVLVEVGPYPLRVQLDITGPNGLVGILRGGLGLVAVGLAVVILAAPAAQDIVLGRRQRLFGDSLGVGTHIGDEAHGAHAGNLHAFIELLRQRHGALGRHAQLPGRLLLQGGGDKRRRRGAPLLAALDALHLEGLPPAGVGDSLNLGFAAQLPFFRIAVKPRGEGARLVHPVQIHVDGPILLGLEGPNFILPVHHQPRGHRLDPPRRKAAANFLPQQG